MKKILKYVIYAIISGFIYCVGFIAWQAGFDFYSTFQRLMENPPVGASVTFAVFMFIYYLVQDFRKSKKYKEA